MSDKIQPISNNQPIEKTTLSYDSSNGNNSVNPELKNDTVFDLAKKGVKYVNNKANEISQMLSNPQAQVNYGCAGFQG